MIGEDIPKRFLPAVLRELCEERGATLESFSEDWIIRMEQNTRAHWVVGYTFDINGASAVMLARDKVGTYTALAHTKIPAVEHYLARSRAEPNVNKQRLHTLPGNVPYVAKPLLGSSGKYITRFDTLAGAVDHINLSNEPEWAISPWYDFRSERRVILLDSEVLLSYEKTEPTIENGLRFFNLARGAMPNISDPTPKELDLARRAMQTCSLRLAAVDIVTDTNSVQRVMEINDGISLEHFTELSPENHVMAKKIYQKILDAIFA